MSQTARPASLKALALQLGLSPATVSRVLSGQAERYRISPLTRERILARARDAGLVLNHQARSLRLKRSCTIGLVVPDIANPFFALLAREVTRSARQQGYAVLLADSEEDGQLQQQALDALQGRQVDGLILAPVGAALGTPQRRLLRSRPCVLVDRLLPDLCVPSVTSDHHGGAELATRCLLSRGHRRIACVQGNTDSYANAQRVAGWRAALRTAGIRVEPAWLAGERYSIDAGAAAAAALLRGPNPPSAILALGNLLALGVLEAARTLHLQVPRDLSLIAFDEQPWTAASEPPLTCIAQPIEGLAHEAVNLLMAAMRDPSAAAPARTLPVHLIERASVRDHVGPALHLAGARRAGAGGA